MTNEAYLVGSYLAAAVGGVLLAGLTALWLAGPLRRAAAPLRGAVGCLFGRALPAWLILLVLGGFFAVSYIDCDHTTYEAVVADRAHLEDVTAEQARHILTYLGVGVLSFSAALAVATLICPPSREGPAEEA